MPKNSVDIEKLSTEKVNPRTIEIYKDSTLDIVKKINYEDSLIATAISEENKHIAQVIDLGYNTIKQGGRLIYIGAGTSGRIGVLDASEIFPTYGVKDKIIALIAGGTKAIQSAMEYTEDNRDLALKDLKKIHFTSKDILIGLTASGRTPYVVAALQEAQKIGAKTVCIATSLNSQCTINTNISIVPKIGPEPIVGSTRMKSGTAQKMILNMISTGIMIKLGHVYQNYMINLVPSNLKLISRSKNIIKQLTQATDKKIDEVFEQSKNIKVAIIMIENNCDLATAQKIVAKGKRNV